MFKKNTAIFLFYRLKRSRIRVILGDHNQFIATESQAIMRAVSAIIRHRNFDAESYNHDIALLRMRKPVSFSKIIKPVCLPKIGECLLCVFLFAHSPLTYLAMSFQVLNQLERTELWWAGEERQKVDRYQPSYKKLPFPY